VTRPLPPRPSLENLKKQAKDLLKVHKRGNAEVCATLRLLHRFAAASPREILAAEVALHDAQHALALDYGFTSWTELKSRVARGRGPSTTEISHVADDRAAAAKTRSVIAAEERILAIEFGSCSVKVAECENPAAPGVRFTRFERAEYQAQLTADTRRTVLAGVLRDMLAKSDFRARKCMLAASGQAVFCRFVKLPPVGNVEEDQLRRILEFEARQNIPLPIAEVVWDYQLITNSETGDRDVMFVVVRRDIVDDLNAVVEAVGLTPVLLDMAPAACHNAALANHIGDEELELVLNIGCRSTSLLFVGPEGLFVRIVPTAGHSVTQQVGEELGVGFVQAEALKREHGDAALAEGDAAPRAPEAAAVAKSVRDNLAGICEAVRKSIEVHGTHVSGERPAALYLTGGGSMLKGAERFLAEELDLPTERFDPLQHVETAPGVDRRQLRPTAHLFSEVVGLGLRCSLERPVEIDLLPRIPVA